MGEYIILERLGKGGMGEVYKAYHRRMHREVAIKVLLESGVQSQDKIERFRREAIAAARMNHPNIVTAYDANEHEGIPYLVMEYVKGRDLASLVKKGDKLPVPEAVNYMLQTARGMEYAHSRHIIHRDLKPSNLLLASPDDSDIRPGMYSRVKILDMGLARLTQQDGELVSPALEGSDLSATGILMGTVDYMAPEQAMDTKRADHRSDIYSLGCTLYYLLTKKPVYTGANLLERISAHYSAPIPSLKDARPDVPEELDEVFKKMVAKRPRDRYQSMTDVALALQKIDRQLSGPNANDYAWPEELSGSGEYQPPGSSYGGSKTGSKSGSGSQGSAPTIASGSGPFAPGLPGSSFGSTAIDQGFSGTGRDGIGNDHRHRHAFDAKADYGRAVGLDGRCPGGDCREDQKSDNDRGGKNRAAHAPAAAVSAGVLRDAPRIQNQDDQRPRPRLPVLRRDRAWTSANCERERISRSPRHRRETSQPIEPAIAEKPRLNAAGTFGAVPVDRSGRGFPSAAVLHDGDQGLERSVPRVRPSPSGAARSRIAVGPHGRRPAARV